MSAAIYFKLSDNGELPRFSTKQNEGQIDALDVLKKVVSFIKMEDFSIDRVMSAHTRRGAYATSKFETENVQVVLASEKKLPETHNETSAFLLLFWPAVPFWKSILGYKPTHTEYIDKTLGAFKQALLEQLHATDVRILTQAEANSLKEFH